MALIRAGMEVDDDVVHVPDGTAVPELGRFTVSLPRFLSDIIEPALPGRLAGVRLAPADEPAALVPFLASLDLIEIEFPVHTDGRGFSQARLLRQRYGFAGELRAVGRVLRDQIFFMHRSGFDAYSTREAELSDVIGALSEITEVYQPASDSSVPVFRKRLRLEEAGHGQ